MPKIRRKSLPEAVLRHLLTRMRQREIGHDQLVLFAEWFEEKPEVPAGP